jgi:hypothetical protein
MESEQALALVEKALALVEIVLPHHNKPIQPTFFGWPGRADRQTHNLRPSGIIVHAKMTTFG